MAQRLAETITQRDGRIESGHFHLGFTAINDMAPSFMLDRAIQHQRQDLESIQACVDALSDDPALLRLAEEVLGKSREHLEMLEKNDQ